MSEQLEVIFSSWQINTLSSWKGMIDKAYTCALHNDNVFDELLATYIILIMYYTYKLCMGS